MLCSFLFWKSMQKALTPSLWSSEMTGGKSPGPFLLVEPTQPRITAGIRIFTLSIDKHASWCSSMCGSALMNLIRGFRDSGMSVIKQLVVWWWFLLFGQPLWVVWYVLHCPCEKCLRFLRGWYVQNWSEFLFLLLLFSYPFIAFVIFFLIYLLIVWCN